ncbi:hypothetical protein OOK31_13775 [Streptomyces sp. NBC_00249]|uniref:hypothetical protein n=1 Tax=Streptomyces sp. NBC_00249 TaxID=2975690 RepID=UPI00225BD13C|nr:hypothetical protein [Streptomyces sp. NBC_00249]MCX5194959.1 hypothetical protein [Streptomyces sp. NBC_00249]
MRTALVRRSVLAASAVSLSLLATACGSDSDTKADAKPEGKPAASASAPAAGAKAKSAAELTALLVAQADLPEFTVEEDKAAKAGQAQKYEGDKADCKPVIQLQSYKALGTPVGTAGIAALEKPKKPADNATVEEKLDAIKGGLSITRTSVILSSYDGKGAEEAFAALKTATTACAAGYTVTVDGEPTKVEKVAPSAPVTAGDEALAFNTVLDLKDGDKNTMQFVVVRKGNTLASFFSVSVAGTATQPKPVVEAQAKKIG